MKTTYLSLSGIGGLALMFSCCYLADGGTQDKQVALWAFNAIPFLALASAIPLAFLIGEFGFNRRKSYWEWRAKQLRRELNQAETKIKELELKGQP